MLTDLTSFCSWSSKSHSLSVTETCIEVMDKYFNVVMSFYRGTPKHIIVVLLSEFGFKQGGIN